MADQTTLLIVGAGPTGLSAAVSLVKHGFHDFIIVDQATSRPNTSRATTVHAATLEVRLSNYPFLERLPMLKFELVSRQNRLRRFIAQVWDPFGIYGNM
jgi:2-polyprenyl-6-methoxyphenol hydroxylase-like FAD-dependent oxidoreductase